MASPLERLPIPSPSMARSGRCPRPTRSPCGATASPRSTRLLVANMRHAGALRIDHVMGLRRLFVVPDGAGAIDGAYVTYPMEDLLAQVALQSQRARCLVVGEDLGTVPEGMSEALAASNILSYSVLWFERQDGAYSSARQMAPPGRRLRLHP